MEVKDVLGGKFLYVSGIFWENDITIPSSALSSFLKKQ